MKTTGIEYTSFTPAIYEAITATVVAHIAPGSSIVDIGSNDGYLEDFFERRGDCHRIYAVDNDDDAINRMSSKTYRYIRVQASRLDANAFLRTFPCNVDVWLSSASLHEINTPADQAGYLDWFFAKAAEKTKMVIIGDLYFPTYLSDEEVNAFRDYQMREINHASDRELFILPELIEAAALKHGFRFVFKDEIRAVEEIDRRYYTMVFTKS